MARGYWGDVFLKNVYTVFDVDQSRIGMSSVQHLHPSAIHH